ncbi:MAG: hypothetical protein JWO06_2377 [Bacteroidota bacterium]|nr:hypothetical protein [Bacteroidota bacterium]
MDTVLETNLNTVAKAIKFKEIITFTYDDGDKYRVEPFCLGIHKVNKNYVVRCYQYKAAESKDNLENWRLFDVEKMTGVRLSAVRIKDTRNGYNGGDKEMSKIIVSI